MSPASTPPALPADAGRIVGCRLCDALNRRPHGLVHAHCWRCTSALPEAPDTGLQDTAARLQAVLALLLTAWVCIALVHLLPLVSLELQGHSNALSLFETVRALWREQRELLAAALFLTTVAAPAAEVGAMLVAVLALQARQRSPWAPVPRWLRHALHTWQGMREWNMTEVLVLGTAVALVKLGEIATLVIGPGLLALTSFMALRLLALRLFSTAQAWALIEPPRRAADHERP